ncbi:MAG: hypothetical protein RL447_760, partial [Bacteroidota bacterium]
SAKFQIESNNKGFLQPRIALNSTTDVTTIASPATGLMVYNTATAGSGATAITPGVHYFDGTKWVRMDATQSSSGASSPAVFVSGRFVYDNDLMNTRPITSISGGYTFKTLKCAQITLPAGKWEVHMKNYCEMTSPCYINSACVINMMYWLQNSDSIYDIKTEGVIPAAIPNPMNGYADYYKIPPLGGGDTLFSNSATIVLPVNTAYTYHQGTFFINNTSGGNKTYYLFSSEYVICAQSNNTIPCGTNMPRYRTGFASTYHPFNKFYAIKIE